MSRARMVLAAAAIGAFAAAMLVAPAKAGGRGGVIASGLDSPRGLTVARDGTVYVAEAGRGGAGPCFPGPEGGNVCFGTSGAVTKVAHGKQKRVLTGLPSIGAEGTGEGAIGPSDVSLWGNNLYVTVGLGADPAVRAGLPASGQRAGWLLRDGRKVADVAGFEGARNPEGVQPPDSNPNSVLATPSAQVVADAGGNTLLRVAANGKISVLAVFPPLSNGAQAVPTSVVRGPDGAYYVGLLSGFPFTPGVAAVYRAVPGKAPTVFASGFTNISDIGFSDRGTLYVLEIAKNGLTGALIRVGRDGSQKEVATGKPLIMPGGLALSDDHAYVSNCGVCPGGGELLKIRI